MQVKICGVCRAEDARMVERAGADYVGVVLAPGTARSQSVQSAGEIYASAGTIRRAGVFVDAEFPWAASVARQLGLHILQLHGSEDAEHVSALRDAGDWRVWKALRPRSQAEFMDQVKRYATVVHGILLDGYSAHATGGSGTAFPWEDVARARDRFPAHVDLIVAGGLHAANVERVIELLAPGIVDVSSGVEESRGIKSESRVRAFIAAARSKATAGSSND
jgi:phosphoribosylanthranilate isomerase